MGEGFVRIGYKRLSGISCPDGNYHLTIQKHLAPHKQASAAVDWLAMADLMDARTNRSQDYAFCRYLPLAAAGVHYLCRSDQRAVVSQPKKV